MYEIHDFPPITSHFHMSQSFFGGVSQDSKENEDSIHSMAPPVPPLKDRESSLGPALRPRDIS